MMYLETQETARLYKLLSDKLGNDITEAMFKYINNKSERSVEASVKTLATKNDIAVINKNIGKAKANTIKWLLIFWLGHIGATVAVIMLFIKK